MNEEVHGRAADLIAQQHVEEIPPAERDWLERHLQDCHQCAAFAMSTHQALQSLRSFSVSVPPALARRTQMRVHLRIHELAESRRRLCALWVSCALSWVVGVASAPLVWRAFAWLGRESRLPAFAWQAGFVLWWFIPAGAALGMILWYKARAGEEHAGARTLPTLGWWV
jgi:hypothetical protein